jgi:branched-chain amino acid transport system substrate-binding protein
MRLRWFAAALLVGALFPASGCGKRGAGDEIPIGEYGSLTGTTATFGISTDNAVKMAFEEINAAGGVLGKKLKLYVEDDQSKPEEAATAATKLVNQNHVVALIGEVASSRSLAAGPIAQARSDSDDHSVFDESPCHAGRRLHLPRVSDRSLPGPP